MERYNFEISHRGDAEIKTGYGPYVLYSDAMEEIAAKDKEIAELRAEKDTIEKNETLLAGYNKDLWVERDGLKAKLSRLTAALEAANKECEIRKKTEDSALVRVERLTAALKDDERAEKVVHQEGFGSLSNASYILGRRKAVNDYRTEILKEVL